MEHVARSIDAGAGPRVVMVEEAGMQCPEASAAVYFPKPARRAGRVARAQVGTSRSTNPLATTAATCTNGGSSRAMRR